MGKIDPGILRLSLGNFLSGNMLNICGDFSYLKWI